MSKKISELPLATEVTNTQYLLGTQYGYSKRVSSQLLIDTTIDQIHDVVPNGEHGFMNGADKAKLDGIEAGAEVNVNADWNAVSGDAQILNKPNVNDYQLISGKGQSNGYCPLDATAKVDTSFLPDSIVGQLQYIGVWNAFSNLPEISSASNINKGHYYVVSVSGSTNIDGNDNWIVGDWIVSNGSTWDKVDNTDSVSSVFGRNGVIVSVNGDYTASQITNIPNGNIAATTVQAAINELDIEKSDINHTHGNLIAGDGITGNIYNGSTGYTWSIASHSGTASSIGTIVVGADTIGVSLGTTSTTAAAGNHTHTSSGITDFTEATQDVIGGILSNTNSINLTYDDNNNIITANANFGTTSTTIAQGNHTHLYAGSSNVGGAANSVANSLIIKSDNGITEGTDLYTFDGSSSKTVNLSSGTNITISESSGDLKFDLTGTIHSDRGVVAGSTSPSFIKYNGTTPLNGSFNGGNTTPTENIRLNYNGYFYPTYLNLVGSADTAITATHYFVETSGDGFVRPKTLANVKTEIVTSAAVISGLGYTPVSSVTGTAPIVSSGGTTPTISISPATSSTAGSMSKTDKAKLDGIEAGAEVNVNADWNAVSGDAQILNKPSTFTPSTHTHGNITNNGYIGTTASLPLMTGTDGIIQTGTFGTTAGTVAQGNDSRFVTNGNSHDHSGGDGAQIAYSNLSGLPSLGTISSQAASSVAITGGSINATTIGATTPSTGKFTSLESHGSGNISTNQCLGTEALSNNTTGINNTASGNGSLYSNTTGINNTASGGMSLYSNTTGVNNTASGYMSLYSNTTGNYNTASGNMSLYSNTEGNYNTASGNGSLYFNTTGINNTASGGMSLYSNTTGSNNTAFGILSLYSNTTGNYNTAVGYNAGAAITTGSGNTILGANINGSAVLENNIILGSGNIARATFDGTNWNFTGQTVVTTGTVTAPSLTFSGDTNTGIYSAGDNTLGIAADEIQMGIEVTPSLSIKPNTTPPVPLGLSTFGTSLSGKHSGHTWFELYGNDSTDSFSILTDVNFDGIIDTVALQVKDSGNVLVGTTTDDDVNKLQVNGSTKATQYRLSALNTAPASATDTGTLGEIRVTADYIYVCTATNTWKRTALSTW